MMDAFSSFLQDDLGTLSEVKSFGDLVVNLYNEDILPDYTIRTLKVSIYCGLLRLRYTITECFVVAFPKEV